MVVQGSSATAYLADVAPPHQRAQALALLRSGGDLGLLLGATALGAVADAASLEAAFGVGALLMVASGAQFALAAEESSGPRATFRPSTQRQ